MRILVAGLLATIIVAMPAMAQTTRVIAVADLVDETHGGVFISASRLNEPLATLINNRAGGRLRVASVAVLRDEMRARGLTPRDLVSPTSASVIAVALGADLIVTGRWTHLDADARELEPFFSPGSANAVLEIRVLDVATRRVVLRDSFHGVAAGGGAIGMLWRAAYMALYHAADTIGRL
ncbi:MAG: hypothetical protein ACRDFA_05895 [bacterium]